MKAILINPYTKTIEPVELVLGTLAAIREALGSHNADIAREAAKKARKEALEAAITCTYTLAAGEAVAWRIRCEFARRWPDEYDKETQ